MRFAARLAFALPLGVAACAHAAASAPNPAPAGASAESTALPASVQAKPDNGAVADADDTRESEPQNTGPGWLGVELATRMPEQPGVLVRSVVPGSPAERAGVLAGDVILSVEGQSVARPSELVSEIAGRHARERVALAVLRNGDNRLFAAELEALPNEEALMKKRYLDAQAPKLGELKAVQGNAEPSLGALRGRVVVLEFWATWCVPCRLTAPLLTSWSDQHGAEGLSVLGVTTDPVAIAADGARKAAMSYSVFSDESGETVRSYRAFALPTMFVIDRRGRVRDVVVGYSSVRLRQVEQLLSRLLAER